MFDLDASKIVIVGVAALIFIPPKDLPRVLRQVGQFVGKMKRMASEFQGQFMDAMREADMADLRKEAQKLSEATRIDVGMNSVLEPDQQMRPISPLPSRGSLERSSLIPPVDAMAPPLAAPADPQSAPAPSAHPAPAPELEPQHTT